LSRPSTSAVRDIGFRDFLIVLPLSWMAPVRPGHDALLLLLVNAELQPLRLHHDGGDAREQGRLLRLFRRALCAHIAELCNAASRAERSRAAGDCRGDEDPRVTEQRRHPATSSDQHDKPDLPRPGGGVRWILWS
jgi:hypothetical protein